MKQFYWKKSTLFWLIIALLIVAPIFALPKKAFAAASFYLSPSSGEVTLGDTVSASVMIDTGGAAINAAEGTVSFASDVLEYQSVSTSGSIFTFWTSGPTGGANSVSFGGGLANPGYNGGGGKVLTIVWKAKAPGAATISISGSKILANDGAGTNIYGSSSGGTFTVGEAKTSQTVSVQSSSHPEQNAWYNQKKVALSWSVKSASGYSFDFNQTVNTDPKSAAASTTSKSYDASTDGVWYFHVKGQFDSNWGPITHFKVQIDTVPPEEFTVTINQEGGTTNPTPIVTFEAKDATSGIDHYDAVVDNGTPTKINSGDKLPKQRPGDHTLIIKAYDKAGNSRDSKPSSFHIQGIPVPEIVGWSKIVGLLEPIIFAGWASPDDTIVIYLTDEEVVRFKASDSKVSENGSIFFSRRALANSADRIAWEYVLKKPLMAGNYNFFTGRIDKNEAESELTKPLKVKVVASYIKIFGYTISTVYLLVMFLAIIGALVAVIIFLLKKLREMAKSGKGPIGLAYNKLRQLFSKTEGEIDQEIDKTIPEYDLSRGVIKEVKKDLKRKIHQDIEKEEAEVGALEPEQPSESKEPEQSEQPEKKE